MSLPPPNPLLSATEQAIALAWGDDSVYKDDGEPAHVARLVAQLPQRLVSAWAGIALPHGGLTVTGVFCHHRPKVQWTPPIPMTQKSYSPELADLVLIVESPNAPVAQRNLALLIQAKMGNLDGSFRVGRGSELAQRYMYANWPAFVFAALPSQHRLQGQVLKIGGQSGSGTRYAAIQALNRKAVPWRLELTEAIFPQENGCLTFSEFSHPSYAYMAGGSLAEVLLGMCSGQGMHPAHAFQPGGTDDWTRVIEYVREFAGQMQAQQHPLPSTRLPKSTKHVPSWVNGACLFGTAPMSNAWETRPSDGALLHSFLHALRLQGGRPHTMYQDYTSMYFGTPGPEGEPPGRGFGVLTITLDEPLRLREP